LVQQAYALLQKEVPEQMSWARHLRLEFRHNQGRLAYQIATELHLTQPRSHEEVLRWSRLGQELLEPLAELEPENGWGRYMLAISHLRLAEPHRATGGPALWEHYR